MTPQAAASRKVIHGEITSRPGDLPETAIAVGVIGLLREGNADLQNREGNIVG
jgi:hypothetical protein